MPVIKPLALAEKAFIQERAITWPIKMLPLRSCDMLWSKYITYSQPSDQQRLMDSYHAWWALLVNER